MKINIVNNPSGPRPNLRITNAETGEDISNRVTNLTLVAIPGHAVMCDLLLRVPVADINIDGIKANEQ